MATHMGAAEMKVGHEEEYADETSAAPWPQFDGVRPKTSPALVDDDRRSEDGEGRGGAKYNTYTSSRSSKVIDVGANRKRMQLPISY